MADVWLAAGAGLAASVGMEQLMVPRPPLARPRAAWAVQGGMWLLAHAVLTLALGRPWFAAAGVSALLLILVLVNNAKMRALREPFVFQDYEYFIDALRHPRLYIPFMGWGRFLAAVAGGAAAVAVGLWSEAAPERRFDWMGQWAGVAVELAVGGFMLAVVSRRLPAVSFRPEQDIRSLGFLACLWRYAQAEKVPLSAASPFEFLPVAFRNQDETLPHLVAVQSESFFDPRPLFSGIRLDVLAEFDRLRDEAVLHGPLQVPAWGANTVRTEFAFLTGIAEDRLGVHRFNPYRAIAAGWNVPALASLLKRLGYRTVAVHPYPGSFYRRDRVYPRLGFDEFLDIRAFAGAACFGPYVADEVVADKVIEILEQAQKPVFIFVITMENHGPLHLERVTPGDVEALYTAPPPKGCDDLTVYLRHLRNADRMIGRLRQALARCERPASLCWFGDHVPIMPSVYEAFGAPGGAVEYVCWNNRETAGREEQEKPAHGLGLKWLHMAGPSRM